MIIVKPNGGLGNRMRVIHSALLLAKLHNQQSIRVLWKKDPGLNAGFYELFQKIPSVRVDENLVSMAIRFYVSKTLPTVKFVDDNLSLARQYDIDFWRKVSQNFLINTCIDFLSHENADNFYTFFRPVDHIQIRIDDMVEKFTEDTVGVQVRRTDNRVAIHHSPLEGFISQMRKEIETCPSVTFFLCTDDLLVEKTLKETFGNKIIVQEDKELSRNSREGIESAMIDMYALSKTKCIMGSYRSSFGEVAAYIGKIPFLTV